ELAPDHVAARGDLSADDTFAGRAAQSQVEPLILVAAVDDEGHHLAGPAFEQGPLDVVTAQHRRVADADERVAGLEAGRRGRAAGLDAIDDDRASRDLRADVHAIANGQAVVGAGAAPRVQHVGDRA